MIIRAEDVPHRVDRLLSQPEPRALFIVGDAAAALRQFPGESVDTVITSPPYWRQREYDHPDAIGGEATPAGYVAALLAVFAELQRVTRRTGSVWLNIGDTYEGKRLTGIPWRVALALQDEQGWILRNDVIWNKVKGAPDNAKDKLRNLHEDVFHLVKQKEYYYDADAIRNTRRKATVNGGSVVTATGVSGVNYRRQIQRNPNLSDEEKQDALDALETMLQRVARGELADFRMIIRGQQRTTHSDSTRVSGRASELSKRGFYFLTYHRNGSKPGDVWDIIPEDKWRRDPHFAPFPEELCQIPIRASCPPGGVVLDPFAGTGTAVAVAVRLGRKGIGIDLSREYPRVAERRIQSEQSTFL